MTELVRPRDVVLAVLWPVLVIGTAIYAVVVTQLAGPARAPLTAAQGYELGVLAGLVGLSILAMPVTGFLAGRAPQRVARVIVASGYIWGLQMIGYVILWLGVPVSPGSTDNDTPDPAVVVILGIPTIFGVLTLVALGTGARLLVEKRQAARAPGALGHSGLSSPPFASPRQINPREREALVRPASVDHRLAMRFASKEHLRLAARRPLGRLGIALVVLSFTSALALGVEVASIVSSGSNWSDADAWRVGVTAAVALLSAVGGAQFWTRARLAVRAEHPDL